MNILLSVILSIMVQIHQPAVAGQFYPADAETLTAIVEGFLDSASTRADRPVQAVIVPHAGYVFSGAVAAEAYAGISPAAVYERIFIIGPGHREAFRGAAVDGSSEVYSMPLGDVSVDTRTCLELAAADSVFHNRRKPFEKEHCLEVQIPFLQVRLKRMPPIVPVIISSVDGNDLGRIVRVLKPYFTQENLFVISSDFSHYPSYDDACKVDRATGDAILSGSVEEFLNTLLDNARQRIPGLATSACGQLPIAALLMMMEGREDLEIRHLDYRNSGDSQYGDKDGVVGYHAFTVVYKEPVRQEDSESGFALTDQEKAILLETARRSIETAFEGKYWLPSDTQLTQTLKAECGAFVTMTGSGR